MFRFALPVALLLLAGARSYAEERKYNTAELQRIPAPDDSEAEVQAVSYYEPPYDHTPEALAPLDDGVLDRWLREGNYYYDLDVIARANYMNDQRYQWTGQEATFGAEGAVIGHLEQEINGWLIGIDGELFLNQRYDRNILSDTPERASYVPNFQPDIIELSQLFISARYDDWLIAAGKMVTPFGRMYFPLLTNARVDAPFIHTEVILWRETGLLLQYDPGILTMTVAIMNGNEDRDTNSSKAVISRIGVDAENFAFGGSIKWQDGISSEGQKRYNNYAGLDAMLRGGPFTLSGEVIYDEYGFRHPYNPTDIFWGRSIYHRDSHLAEDTPLSGVGYYVNLTVEGQGCTANFNYGVYHPHDTLGDPIHDRATTRGVATFIQHVSENFDIYFAGIVENDVPNAQDGRTRQGFYFTTGLQLQL